MLHNLDEKPTSKDLKRVEFGYNRIDVSGAPKHYIMIDRQLSTYEYAQLSVLLASFPCAGHYKSWPKKFLSLNFEQYSHELLFIAANAYDNNGNTMLGIAAEKIRLDVVKLLLEMGASINTPDHHMNKLPLHWAIISATWQFNQEKYSKLLSFLLDNGARIDLRCYKNKTLLEYAIDREYNFAADFLREYEKNKMETICHAASQCDILAIKTGLLNLKKNHPTIDINTIKNSRGETLLILSAMTKRQLISEEKCCKAVEFLLSMGADASISAKDGRTPLMMAANFTRGSLIKLLLDNIPFNQKIAYIDMQDNVKNSAKIYASITNPNKIENAEIIELLESVKKKVTDTIKNLNVNVNLKKLDYINEFIADNNLLAINEIILNHKNTPADLSSSNPLFKKAIHYAISLNRYDIVKYFQTNKETSENFNNEINDFIHLAVKIGNLRILKLLTEDISGANPQINYHIRTNDNVIISAIESGHSEIVEHLLQNGAKAEGDIGRHRFITNICPVTFLGKAAKDNNEEIVESFVKHGADVKNAIVYNYLNMTDTINIHQKKITYCEGVVEKLEHINKIDEIIKNYQKSIKLLMHYAAGIDFTENSDDKYDEVKNNLNLFERINLSEMNFTGVSLDGKPITKEMLNERKLPDANKIVTNLDEMKKLIDSKSSGYSQKNIQRLTAAFNKYGKLIDEKTGIVNLVPLNSAAKIGDIVTVKARLRAGADPNKAKTILIAAEMGQLAIVELLTKHEGFDKSLLANAISEAKKTAKRNVIDYLESIKDVNQADEDGNTDLHRAAIAGDYGKIENLLKNSKININLTNKSGATALYLAADKTFDRRYFGKPSPKHIMIVELLLTNKADANIQCYNSTPLNAAISAGSSAAAALLLPHTDKKPAPIFEFFNREKIGEKPWYEDLIFSAANSKEKVQILTLLYKAGANLGINKSGKWDKETLLHKALRNFPSGNEITSIMRELQMSILGCEHRLPANTLSKRQNELIDESLVIFEKHMDYLNFLLNHEVDPRQIDCPNERNGETALHSFLHHIDLSHIDNGYSRVIDACINKGFDINIKDKLGRTLMHVAASKGKYVVVNYLIMRGAGIDTPDIDGRTPLHHAACGSPITTKLLINNGADSNATDLKGNTPIQFGELALTQELTHRNFTKPEYQVEFCQPYYEARKFLYLDNEDRKKITIYRNTLFANSGVDLPSKCTDIISGYANLDFLLKNCYQPK